MVQLGGENYISNLEGENTNSSYFLSTYDEQERQIPLSLKNLQSGQMLESNDSLWNTTSTYRSIHSLAQQKDDEPWKTALSDLP